MAKLFKPHNYKYKDMDIVSSIGVSFEDVDHLVNKVSMTVDDIHEANNLNNRLLEKLVDLKAVDSNEDATLTDYKVAIAVAQETLDVVSKRLSLENMCTISYESYRTSEIVNQELALTHEGVMDAIKWLIEMIKKAFLWIINQVKKFYNWIKSLLGLTEKKAKKVDVTAKEVLAAIKGSEYEKPFKESLAAAAELSLMCALKNPTPEDRERAKQLMLKTKYAKNFLIHYSEWKKKRKKDKVGAAAHSSAMAKAHAEMSRHAHDSFMQQTQDSFMRQMQNHNMEMQHIALHNTNNEMFMNNLSTLSFSLESLEDGDNETKLRELEILADSYRAELERVTKEIAELKKKMGKDGEVHPAILKLCEAIATTPLAKYELNDNTIAKILGLDDNVSTLNGIIRTYEGVLTASNRTLKVLSTSGLNSASTTLNTQAPSKDPMLQNIFMYQLDNFNFFVQNSQWSGSISSEVSNAIDKLRAGTYNYSSNMVRSKLLIGTITLDKAEKAQESRYIILTFKISFQNANMYGDADTTKQVLYKSAKFLLPSPRSLEAFSNTINDLNKDRCSTLISELKDTDKEQEVLLKSLEKIEEGIEFLTSPKYNSPDKPENKEIFLKYTAAAVKENITTGISNIMKTRVELGKMLEQYINDLGVILS